MPRVAASRRRLPVARALSSTSQSTLPGTRASTRIQVPIDFLGFTIDDKFVVGYGLDWDGKLRNLPFVGVPRS